MRRRVPYTLAHGITVLNESHGGTYVMCEIEAHPSLFPNTKITGKCLQRQRVSRARAVMTAKLGRALRTDEHVHHKNSVHRHDDNLKNLVLKSAFEHNSEHHKGLRHTNLVKKRISASLKIAYSEGRHRRPKVNGQLNPFFGKKHTPQTREKMRRAKLGKPLSETHRRNLAIAHTGLKYRKRRNKA